MDTANNHYATIRLPVSLYQRVRDVGEEHALVQLIEMGLRLKEWEKGKPWEGEYWKPNELWSRMEMEADEDIAKGNVSGPFDSVDDFFSSLLEKK